MCIKPQFLTHTTKTQFERTTFHRYSMTQVIQQSTDALGLDLCPGLKLSDRNKNIDPEKSVVQSKMTELDEGFLWQWCIWQQIPNRFLSEPIIVLLTLHDDVTAYFKGSRVHLAIQQLTGHPSLHGEHHCYDRLLYSWPKVHSQVFETDNMPDKQTSKCCALSCIKKWCSKANLEIGHKLMMVAGKTTQSIKSWSKTDATQSICSPQP